MIVIIVQTASAQFHPRLTASNYPDAVWIIVEYAKKRMYLEKISPSYSTTKLLRQRFGIFFDIFNTDLSDIGGVSHY